MLFRFIPASLLALAAAFSSPLVQAAQWAGTAAVLAVQPGRVADLVVFDSGFDAGFRQGMICRVTRDGLEVAEVVIVGLRPNHSAALIVSVAPRQAVRIGDSARIKLLKS